jgi:hypothetical protein
MVLRSVRQSGGRRRSAAAVFSRRWATDEVPGMTTLVGERWRSQARATCCGVAFSLVATFDHVVGTLDQVVEVLDGDDRGDRLGLADLWDGDGAQPEVADQTLLL